MNTTNWWIAAACAFAWVSAPAFAEDKKPDDKPVTDAEFVIKAASGGMFEVQSSQTATTASQNAEVKRFAEMMVADHGKANKELMTIAKESNLGVPVKMLETHQTMLDKVNGAKAGDFDKTYWDAQRMAHEEAVALFTNASKNVKDAKLKAFAEKTLPVIKGHLEMVNKQGKAGSK